MKANIAVAALFCASAVLAAPFTELHRERRGLILPVNINEGVTIENSRIGLVKYTSNWSGALLEGTDFTSVSGSFNVPHLQVPSGGGSGTVYSTSIWVGLGGNPGDPILQAGVICDIGNGTNLCVGWYEWFPSPASHFTGVTMAAGDMISVQVTASSPADGVVTLKNLSNGQSGTQSFSNQAAVLTGHNAEWIVEDPLSNNQLLPFADFGTVVFNGCSAITKGTTVDTTGAIIYDILAKDNATIITMCSNNGGSVTCTYNI